MRRPIATAAIGVASIVHGTASDNVWVQAAHVLLGIYLLVCVWYWEGKANDRAKPGEVRINGKVASTTDEVYEAIRRKP